MNVNKALLMIAILVMVLATLACSLPAPIAEAPTSASAPVSTSGACANPYMPVVAGATWNYNLTGPAPDTYTHTVLTVEGNSFTEQDVFGTGLTRQGKWNCDNGNLVALDMPLAGGTSANVSSQEKGPTSFQTTNSNGITLPAVINPGDTWVQSLTLEGTQTANGTSFPVSNQFNNDCKATVMESVTVPAGTFDAMRVECQTTMKISIKMGDTPIENTFNMTGTSWYAQGVGMVKSASSGMGFDSTIELLSYNIP